MEMMYLVVGDDNVNVTGYVDEDKRPRYKLRIENGQAGNRDSIVFDCLSLQHLLETCSRIIRELEKVKEDINGKHSCSDLEVFDARIRRMGGKR